MWAAIIGFVFCTLWPLVIAFWMAQRRRRRVADGPEVQQPTPPPPTPPSPLLLETRVTATHALSAEAPASTTDSAAAAEAQMPQPPPSPEAEPVPTSPEQKQRLLAEADALLRSPADEHKQRVIAQANALLLASPASTSAPIAPREAPSSEAKKRLFAEADALLSPMQIQPATSLKAAAEFNPSTELPALADTAAIARAAEMMSNEDATGVSARVVAADAVSPCAESPATGASVRATPQREAAPESPKLRTPRVAALRAKLRSAEERERKLRSEFFAANGDIGTLFDPSGHTPLSPSVRHLCFGAIDPRTLENDAQDAVETRLATPSAVAASAWAALAVDCVANPSASSSTGEAARAAAALVAEARAQEAERRTERDRAYARLSLIVVADALLAAQNAAFAAARNAADAELNAAVATIHAKERAESIAWARKAAYETVRVELSGNARVAAATQEALEAHETIKNLEAAIDMSRVGGHSHRAPWEKQASGAGHALVARRVAPSGVGAETGDAGVSGNVEPPPSSASGEPAEVRSAIEAERAWRVTAARELKQAKREATARRNSSVASKVALAAVRELMATRANQAAVAAPIEPTPLSEEELRSRAATARARHGAAAALARVIGASRTPAPPPARVTKVQPPPSKKEPPRTDVSSSPPPPPRPEMTQPPPSGVDESDRSPPPPPRPEMTQPPPSGVGESDRSPAPPPPPSGVDERSTRVRSPPAPPLPSKPATTAPQSREVDPNAPPNKLPKWIPKPGASPTAHAEEYTKASTPEGAVDARASPDEAAGTPEPKKGGGGGDQVLQRICATCSVVIPPAVDALKVRDQFYHKACCACDDCECDLSMTEKIVVADDGTSLLCVKCDKRRRGDICIMCKETLNDGRILSVDGAKFHVECMKCFECSTPLHTGKVPFAVGDDALPYCHVCISEQAAKVESGGDDSGAITAENGAVKKKKDELVPPQSALKRKMTATMGGNWPKPEQMGDATMHSLRELSAAVFSGFDRDGKKCIVGNDVASSDEEGEKEELAFILAAFGDDLSTALDLNTFTDHILATAREEGIGEVEAALKIVLANFPAAGSLAEVIREEEEEEEDDEEEEVDGGATEPPLTAMQAKAEAALAAAFASADAYNAKEEEKDAKKKKKKKKKTIKKKTIKKMKQRENEMKEPSAEDHIEPQVQDPDTCGVDSSSTDAGDNAGDNAGADAGADIGAGTVVDAAASAAAASPKRICSSCGAVISAEDSVVKVDGMLYHQTCCVCSDCEADLSVSDATLVRGEDGSLLCVICDKRRRGEVCYACTKALIDGKVIATKAGNKFHEACFCCTDCSTSLGSGDIPFSFEDGGAMLPICHACKEKGRRSVDQGALPPPPARTAPKASMERPKPKVRPNALNVATDDSGAAPPPPPTPSHGPGTRVKAEHGGGAVPPPPPTPKGGHASSLHGSIVNDRPRAPPPSAATQTVPLPLARSMLTRAPSSAMLVINGPRICATCSVEIPSKDPSVKVGGRHHHEACSFCVRCQTQSSEAQLVVGDDGLLRCMACDARLHGDYCHICSNELVGEFHTALGLKYHDECFACTKCGTNLRSGAVRWMLGEGKLPQCIECPPLGRARAKISSPGAAAATTQSAVSPPPHLMQGKRTKSAAEVRKAKWAEQAARAASLKSTSAFALTAPPPPPPAAPSLSRRKKT